MGVKSKKLGLWVNQNFTDSSAHLFLSQNKKKLLYVLHLVHKAHRTL